MTNFIAERKLLYAAKGSEEKNEFIIRLSAPYLVEEGTVSFSVGGESIFACRIEVLGLGEPSQDVYGVDTLQAVTLAANAVDPLLRRLQIKFDLFYLSDEEYF